MIERMVSFAAPVPMASSWAITCATATGSTVTCASRTMLRRLVEIANGISSRVSRPIAWMHLPVPRNRTDDAYFAPLAV